jgi:hypothetical protein
MLVRDDDMDKFPIGKANRGIQAGIKIFGPKIESAARANGTVLKISSLQEAYVALLDETLPGADAISDKMVRWLEADYLAAEINAFLAGSLEEYDHVIKSLDQDLNKLAAGTLRKDIAAVEWGLKLMLANSEVLAAIVESKKARSIHVYLLNKSKTELSREMRLLALRKAWLHKLGTPL